VPGDSGRTPGRRGPDGGRRGPEGTRGDGLAGPAGPGPGLGPEAGRLQLSGSDPFHSVSRRQLRSLSGTLARSKALAAAARESFSTGREPFQDGSQSPFAKPNGTLPVPKPRTGDRMERIVRPGESKWRGEHSKMFPETPRRVRCVLRATASPASVERLAGRAGGARTLALRPSPSLRATSGIRADLVHPVSRTGPGGSRPPPPAPHAAQRFTAADTATRTGLRQTPVAARPTSGSPPRHRCPAPLPPPDGRSARSACRPAPPTLRSPDRSGAPPGRRASPHPAGGR